VKTQLPRNSIEAKRAEAQEVIDILNRWDARMNGHQTQKRVHDRVAYSSRICLYADARNGAHEQGQEGLTVWARNVSARGIAFIYKGQIEWRRILLCLDPDSGEATWMHAEITQRPQRILGLRSSIRPSRADRKRAPGCGKREWLTRFLAWLPKRERQPTIAPIHGRRGVSGDECAVDD
jgi:hypothetical protein